MISKSNVFEKHCDRCDNAIVVIFFKTMCNKTIFRFGFCNIWNNQGRGKCYQPKPKAEADNTNRGFCLRKPSASADNTYLGLDYSGYHKNLIQ